VAALPQDIKIADINNMSESPHAGAITAALYLQEFVEPEISWGPTTNVFAFSVPLKMMLHPNATYVFSGGGTILVSGDLVNFAGP
jgi:hypothetical protein